MHFITTFTACTALFTAALASPQHPLAARDNLMKRFPCEENCKGTFDAGDSFGGNCKDVDTCIKNCNECNDTDQKFTYGTCGCIKKGSCDTKCKTECEKMCAQSSSGDVYLAACVGSCGKQCECL